MLAYEFLKQKKWFHVPEGEEVLDTSRREEVCKRGCLNISCSGSVGKTTEKGLVDTSTNISCQKTEVFSPNHLGMSDCNLDGEKWH